MSKPATVLEAHKVAKSLEIEIPWEVWTILFQEKTSISFFGDQIMLGGDPGSLEQHRKAVEWLANQLGGKVKWQKD